jgi:hypothetical protein
MNNLHFYTPTEIIEKIHGLFEDKFIDLFSDSVANERMRATKYVDKAELFYAEYKMNVFSNPPYTSKLYTLNANILTKSNTDFDYLTLVNSNTSSRWYQQLCNDCDLMLFPNKRLNFIRSDTLQEEKGNRSSQTLFYRGCRKKAFFNIFGNLGAIVTTTHII